jgi:hypothetical protein
VVAPAAFGVDAGGVEARAEVVEAGVGVGQQVPDDDQDGPEGRAEDDFLLRAADQSLAGIVANDPAEAVYLVNMEDADGGKLSGEARCELTFTGTDLPPVDAFWSLTMYKADMNLVPNAASRYSIGDRTTGLKSAADGGITIYIQHDPPGPGEESNWLPCPDRGTWFVILRLYQPHEAVINPHGNARPFTR